MISYIDAGFRYRFTNKYYETWFGRSPEEIIGKHVREFLGDAAFERLRPHGEVALAGHRHSFEEEITFKHDGTRYVYSEFVPNVRPDGSVAGYYALVTDITARKKAEDAVQASDERLSKLLSLMPAGVYTCDAEGRITYYNHLATELWGRVPKLGDEQDKFCGAFRLWQPDGSPMKHVQTAMAEAVQKGISFRNLEVMLEQPNGARLIANVNIDPLYDGEGKIVGAINVFVDVTERKKTEEALRKSEAKLAEDLEDARKLQAISSRLIEEDNIQVLYEHILDAAIALMDANMGSMQVLLPETNELELLASKGFDPGSARFWHRVKAESACTCGIALNTRKRVLVPNVETCDFMAGTEDLASFRLSGIRAVQTTPLISRSGQLVGMISTHWTTETHPSDRDLNLLDVLARQAADLMERKTSEEELRRSKERLQQAISIPTVGILFFDLAGTIHDANEAFQHMSGYSYEALTSGKVRWDEITPPEFMDATLKARDEYFVSGQNTPYEKQYIRPDGSRWWGLFAGKRLNENEYVEFVLDITKLKEAEEKLQQFNELLEQQVLERTSELIKTTEELQKNLAKLQQAEEVAQMGSWEYDIASCEMSWSAGMYRLYGLPTGSPVKPETYLEYVVAEDKPLAQQVVKNLRERFEPIEETLRLQVDGQTLTCRMKAIVQHNEQGAPVKILGIDLNISQVKRLEEENLKMRLNQQKALLLAILEAQEEERRRISEALHNGVGQLLYATKLNLDQAAQRVPKEILQPTGKLLNEAIVEVRKVSHELVPVVLKDFGLEEAIENLCRQYAQSSLQVNWEIDLEGRLTTHLEIALYRISQELLNNVAKHAQATQADVLLVQEDREITLKVRDNGRGISQRSSKKQGIGLRSISDRVKLLNGTFAITKPQTGKGTLVTIKIPLMEA